MFSGGKNTAKNPTTEAQQNGKKKQISRFAGDDKFTDADDKFGGRGRQIGERGSQIWRVGLGDFAGGFFQEFVD